MLASAIAFRLFLWLLPLALLLAGILARIEADHEGSVESASRTAGVTGAASQQVTSALREGDRSWWVAIVIGAVLLLWATRTLMRSLVVVHAHAWQVQPPRLRQREVITTAAAFAGGVLVLLVIAGLIGRLDRLMPGGVVLAVLVQAIVLSAVWLALSRRLPGGGGHWTDLAPGAILAGVSFAVLHAVSRVYLPRRIERSSELYGTLGIAGVILAWLLLVGQVVVCAALVNSLWAENRPAPRPRATEALAGSTSEAQPTPGTGSRDEGR